MSVAEISELYPYANGPLLDEPNTYTYTAYHGIPFLDAWRADRARSRAECNHDVVPDAPVRQLLETWALPARTTDLLHTLRQRMEEDSFGSEEEAVLERLIQRFEVTKRVHKEYSTEWRATDKDEYRDMELVVLFAEAMVDRYAKVPQLDVLNVLLKAMDTLCAYVKVLSPGQQARLAILIDREVIFINALESEVSGR